MKSIANLPREDRLALFNETGVRMGLPPFHIEKDFWVCWTLGVLFGHSEVGPHLTFRGGTSLSKAWGIIQRFSEDIDLAMARDWFGPLSDPGEMGINTAERERRLQALRHECRRVIAEVLLPVLEAEARRLKEGMMMEIEPLAKARDPFCIHVHYPQAGLSAPASYNRAAVKIELSGRAEGWPIEDREIVPYVAREFPGIDARAKCTLSCVKPERTFWEKAALLHEQNVRPGAVPLAPRQARHLYDLTRLWSVMPAGDGFRELWDGVVKHRKSYFDYSWVDYGSLTPAKLKIVPPDERLAEWEADYRAMRAMFYAEPAEFEEVVLSLREIQEKIAAL